MNIVHYYMIIIILKTIITVIYVLIWPNIVQRIIARKMVRWDVLKLSFKFLQCAFEYVLLYIPLPKVPHVYVSKLIFNIMLLYMLIKILGIISIITISRTYMINIDLRTLLLMLAWLLI